MRFIKSYDGYRLIRESEFKIESFLKGVQKNYKLSDEQFNQFVANYQDKLKEIVSKSVDKNILRYKNKYEDYLKHLDNVYNRLKNTNVKSDLDVPELFKMKYGKELIKDDVDKYNELINSSDKEKIKSILKSLINDEDKFILKLHELYTELYNKRNPGTKINPNLEGLKPVGEYDNGNIKVFRVNSLRDSQILGKNTSFCIRGSTMYGSYVYKQKNNIWYIYDFNPKNKDNEINVIMLNDKGQFNFTNIINRTEENLTYDQVLSNNPRLESVDKSVFSYKEINDYYYNNPNEVNPSNNVDDQISSLVGSLNGNRNMPNVNLENKQNLDFLVHNLDSYRTEHEKVYSKFNSKQKYDYINSGGYKGIPNDEYISLIKNTKLDNDNVKKIVLILIDKLGNKADLNFLDVSNVKDMGYMFYGTNFNGDISKWNVSNVTNMEGMFRECKNFNGDISKWNVSNVTNMRSMFYECTNFNGNIYKWNVSNVTNMSYMFSGCRSFNGYISKWNVSNVTNMESMFEECTNFRALRWSNGDISKWNVSNVTNMENMFRECKNFNGDISKWNVSNVTNMRGMFVECRSFNGDISKWNVSNVTNMSYMFYGCIKFTYDLSDWVKVNPEFKDIIPEFGKS